MNGPEHYAEAERLAALADKALDAVPRWLDQTIARAQVHATLALAAATALGVLDHGFDCGDTTTAEAEGWNEALG